MKILITGTAGFIGFHLAKRMLDDGHTVYGIDNINDYYDVSLKYSRLEKAGILKNNIRDNVPVTSVNNSKYTFMKMDISDSETINSLFETEQFDAVCNLAAQAGVRYSLINPHSYIQSNIVGFTNILEACRHNKVKHLVYASSSSVYGANETYPFSTKHNVDHPVSLYAASKKSNELMAHTYSHLFGLPTSGLRFFTVYGPWGRPDMAAFLFTDAILKDEPIKVFNNGEMKRDFTYIDDIVEGVVRIINGAPKGNPDWSGESPDPSCSKAPYRVFNIGNSSPVELMKFIDAIETNLGKKAIKNMMPIQPGDVPATWADVSDLQNDFDYKPNTSIETGVANFVTWFRKYYSV